MGSWAAGLPDDVLADILRRLPARSLAASCRVSKAWRAVVDDQQILLRLRHLLPHSVRGLFINYVDHGEPHFLARPTAEDGRARIDGRFDFVLGEENRSIWYKVRDHCNGLVLYWNYCTDVMYVCNPATRRAATLRHRWLPGRYDDRHGAFLVFDPVVSPHYEVLIAPPEPEKNEVEQAGEDIGACGTMEEEWPPSAWTWHVFSSRSEMWDQRVFVREGDAAGTVGGLPVKNDWYWFSGPQWYYAAYWEGALYVHCRGEFISR